MFRDTKGGVASVTPPFLILVILFFMKNNIHFANIGNLSRELKNKTISPVELVEHMLSRIESIDQRLNSYATICADRAIKEARQAEREILAGQYRGRLHGVPLSVKDLCYTRGIRTMGGLKVRKNFIPTFDSTVVKKLGLAGAVLLGKSGSTEGALSGYNPEFKIPKNPWGDELWAGVSSSGSGVAVSAGLCFGSIGTDTGGSIRYPSMANGVVGLKPTYGAVSRYGVMELAQTLDHVGPLARSVEDVAILFDAISGRDALDPTSLRQDVAPIKDSLSLDVEGMTLGVDFNYIESGTDRGLLSAIDQVIETFKALGVGIVEVKMPRSDPQDLRDLWLPITAFEAAKAHKETFPSRADDYGDYLREVLEHGLAMEERDYLDAQTKRKEYATQFEAQLQKVDAVICPAGGFVFEVDAKTQYGDKETMASVIKNFQGQFTIPSDLIGSPAIVVPCGFSDDKRPYTFQLLGSKVSEGTLCALGYKYEQQYEWNLRHPEF